MKWHPLIDLTGKIAFNETPARELRMNQKCFDNLEKIFDRNLRRHFCESDRGIPKAFIYRLTHMQTKDLLSEKKQIL